MGIDTILRFSYKLAMFVFVVGLTFVFVTTIFNYLPSLDSVVNNECVLHWFYAFGAGSAIHIYLKILIVGWVGKYALNYLRSM